MLLAHSPWRTTNDTILDRIALCLGAVMPDSTPWRNAADGGHKPSCEHLQYEVVTEPALKASISILNLIQEVQGS